MAKLTGFVYGLLLLTVQPMVVQAQVAEVLWFAGGAALTCVAAPAALAAVGFGAGGIIAGSLAAKTMSVVYSTKVGLGALAALQSAGAAGIGTTTVIAGGLVGAGAGHAAGSHSGKEEDKQRRKRN